MATAFWIGACLGSFFNVVAWRVPRGLSVVHPGSRCPSCSRDIPWYRNLPLVSWTLQRGKCAWCGWPIPARYVVFELLCGLLAATWTWSFLRTSVWPDAGIAVAWIAFALLSLPVALIDWEHFEIPDGLVVTMAVAGLLAHLGIEHHQGGGILDLGMVGLERLRDGCLAAGLLYALSFTSRVMLGWVGSGARALLRRIPWSSRRRWPTGLRELGFRWARFHGDMEALGLGDVSLGLAAGIALGWLPVGLGLLAASVLALPAWFLRQRYPACEESALRAGVDPASIPFGPFLSAGFLLVSLFLSGREAALW